MYCLFTGCCYFLSSAINPFLYSLLSKRFRRGFHDLKRKVLSGLSCQIFRRSLGRDKNEEFQTQRPANTSLPNNYLFRYNTKPINNRNALKRHFNIPLSVSARCEEEKPTGEDQAMEMQELVNSKGIQTEKRYTHILAKTSYNGKISQKANELHNSDVEQIACMLKHNDEQSNCRYKVMSEPRANTDTTVIVHRWKPKKEEHEKNLESYTKIKGLKNVRFTTSKYSSALYETRNKNILGHILYNSVPEGKLICNRLIHRQN